MMYSKDFDDKLQYARTYMLLWAPFFGSLTMNIVIEERDYPSRTVWTNGKKVFFETNYAKKLTAEDVMVVILADSGRAYLSKVFNV